MRSNPSVLDRFPTLGRLGRARKRVAGAMGAMAIAIAQRNMCMVVKVKVFI